MSANFILFGCICVSRIIILANAGDASLPVGQSPAIVYTPNQKGKDTFLIYISAQGLQSEHCSNVGDQYPQCDTKTLKCDTKLYSSAVYAVNYTHDYFSECGKHVSSESMSKNNRNRGGSSWMECRYYMVIGYGSLTAKTQSSSVSLLICYDDDCDTMDDILIDTNEFDSTLTYTFGYSISLTTYYNKLNNQRYPMFTYSKFDSDTTKKYILNVIICLDSFCNTWIGKSEQQFASHPPYVILGPYLGQSASMSPAKGVVSIQETWTKNNKDNGNDNMVSIMFSKLVNITNATASINLKNVYVLMIATCQIDTQSGSSLSCIKYGGKALNTTMIFKDILYKKSTIQQQTLKTNVISMQQYYPSQNEEYVPLFATVYTIQGSEETNELWILYCFNPFCNSNNRTFYKLHEVKLIDYPQLALPTISPYFPKILFFENQTHVMFMECEYDTPPTAQWNCTILSYNHIIQPIHSNQDYETSAMQISASINPKNPSLCSIIFSQVSDSGGGGGVFNGSYYITCSSASCAINYSLFLSDSNSLSTEQFSASFQMQVFVIFVSLITIFTVVGIYSIYRFISPQNFISANVRNAYLAKVSLDSSKIRPLSYWFFFANLICSAMCIVPWFAYFDYSAIDYSLYSLMIIPPFIPIILTLSLVLILHICPLETKNNYFMNLLIIISILYYCSCILLSYSFSFVWTLKTMNCETADLSGLKIVILTGQIATILAVEYLLFWNIKSFQALRLASPERGYNYKNNRLHNSLVNDNNNNHYFDHDILNNANNSSLLDE